MTDDLPAAERGKRAAAARALEFVEDGMKLGLGTGSTARWFVDLLAERMRAEGLRITGVTPSARTRAQAGARGIPLATPPQAGAPGLGGGPGCHTAARVVGPPVARGGRTGSGGSACESALVTSISVRPSVSATAAAASAFETMCRPGSLVSALDVAPRQWS